MFGSDAGFEEWAMLRQTNRIAVPPEVTPVPEPGTMMLLGTGLMLAVRKRRR
jgi:hypothetical protein